MNEAGFYRAFEDRHRGSRELIKRRLDVYLPFVLPLRELYGDAWAIDLGCGRGEWLELLRENGVIARGVDLDEGMLEACRALGLTVANQDAVALLRSLPDESQCVVSGFHLAEHLPFSELQVLVAEALRVLEPGGLLILETPNPENLIVGTTNFYLDPTHQRPIPPLLLSFLAEYHGFERIKLLRLQESRALAAAENVGLFDVLSGVSPDYAVVAQKAAAAEVLDRFAAPFAASYGIELAELAHRHDDRIEGRLGGIEERVAAAERSAGAAEALALIGTLQDRLVEAAVETERQRGIVSHLTDEIARSEKRAQAAEASSEAARLHVEELSRGALETGARVEELSRHALEAAARVEEQSRRALEAEARVEELAREVEAAEGRAADQEQRVRVAESHAAELERRVAAAESDARALRQSFSWRLTWPARRCIDACHAAGRHAGSLSAAPQAAARRIVVAALGRPGLVRAVHLGLKPFPRLHAHLMCKVAGIAAGGAAPSLVGGASGGARRDAHERQLLIDVSELIRKDAGTGVQRVTRSILAELMKAPPVGLVVRPVYGTIGENGYRYAGHGDGLAARPEVDECVVIAPGDVFLGLDLQHLVVIQNREYFRRLRQSGVSVYFVVYDLLPISHPKRFPSELEGLHRRWLEVVAEADGALCISNAVAVELQDWLKRKAPARLASLAIRAFPLGAEINGATASAGLPPEAAEILSVIRARPSFLVVGTIEPRKGHLQVIAAFEQLWRGGVDANLVIVGRAGWKVESLVTSLRQHEECGRRLFWLEGASDEFLEAIYSAASCLIAASECEGYGLPLIEAARHGVPIVARDIPVFREIAGDYAFYFDGRTPDTLAEALTEWMKLQRAGSHPKPQGIRISSWAEAARQLLACLPLSAPSPTDDTPRLGPPATPSGSCGTDMGMRQGDCRPDGESAAPPSPAQAESAGNNDEGAATRMRELEERLTAAEAGAHQRQLLADERLRQVVAMQNSLSWQLTAPLRVLGRIAGGNAARGEISRASLRQFGRSASASAIGFAGDLAQTSPRFRSLALWLLRRNPGLQHRLGRAYLQLRTGNVPQPVSWAGVPAGPAAPCSGDVAADHEYFVLRPMNGINASQRTPLESSFHRYHGQP